MKLSELMQAERAAREAQQMLAGLAKTKQLGVTLEDDDGGSVYDYAEVVSAEALVAALVADLRKGAESRLAEATAKLAACNIEIDPLPAFEDLEEAA